MTDLAAIVADIAAEMAEKIGDCPHF